MGGAGFEAGIASHGRSCRYCGRRGCGDWRRGSRRRRRASDADRVGVADLDSSAGEDEGSDGVALCGRSGGGSTYPEASDGWSGGGELGARGVDGVVGMEGACLFYFCAADASGGLSRGRRMESAVASCG